MLKSIVMVAGLMLASGSAAHANSDDRNCNQEIESPEIAIPACQALLSRRLSQDDRYFTLLHLGTAFERTQSADKALNAYNQAVLLDPSKPNVYALRAILYFRTSYFNKCIADSLTALSKWRPKSQIDGSGVSFLTHCYLLNDQPEEALSSAKEILGKAPRNIEAQSSYAEALAAFGRRDEAEGLYEKILALEPNNFVIYESLIDIELDYGDGKKALEYLDQAQNRGLINNSVQALFFRAWALRLLGKFNDAKLALAAAQPTKSNEVDSIAIQCVRIEVASGNLYGARRLADLALAQFSANHVTADDLIAERANVNLLLGRPDMALTDINKALAIKPRSLYYRVVRGLAYLGLDAIGKADLEFDSILLHHKDYAGALLGRAWSLELQGYLTEAREGYDAVISQAVSLDSDHMNDFKSLARARLAALPGVAGASPITPIKPVPNIAASAPIIAAAIDPATVVKVEQLQSPRATGLPVTEAKPLVPPQSGSMIVARLEPPTEKNEPAIAVASKPGPPSNPVRLAAYKFLDTHCARCHQTDKTTDLNKAQRAVANIMDLDAMASNKRWVTPGQPLRSTLYFTVLRREMPYDVQDGDIDKPVPTDAEADALKAWIVSLAPTANRAPKSLPLHPGR